MLFYEVNMIFRSEYRGGVWVDLERPDEEEIRTIAQEFGVSEQIERELVAPSPAPLVTGSEEMTLMVLHFPAPGATDGDTKTQEIDFIVGKDFIISIRYELVAPLHHLKKLLEAQELVQGKTKVTTDVLLEILFAHLYTAMRDHVNHVAANLSRVEKGMFDGRERLTIRDISNISREFLHIEASLANQEDALGHFLRATNDIGIFGPSFSERANRILAERSHVARLVKTHRAVAIELRETNAALLEYRQNDIMKTLTTITIIVLPLELIAFSFGMHLKGTPLTDNPNAFSYVMVIMLATTAVTALYFAWKRWIF